MSGDLVIIVPIHNEAGSIEEFIARVTKLGYREALLLVDNASTDDTLERLDRQPDVRLIRHATNEGYGNSVRHALEASDAERIVIIDGDLEYPPETIPDLLRALEQHPVIYCSRFLTPWPEGASHFRSTGNRFMTGLHNVLFRQRATDVYTGMKALRRSALPLHLLKCSGFENAAEMAGMIAVSGLQIWDIPVEYRVRRKGSSKMRHVPVAFRFAVYELGFWFRHVLLQRPLGDGYPVVAPRRDSSARR